MGGTIVKDREKVVLRNEFASVEVEPDQSANGPRLRIRDLEHGFEIYLDPLELESLTRMDHGRFAEFVDPVWISLLAVGGRAD